MRRITFLIDHFRLFSVAMLAAAGFAAVDCGLRVYPTPDAYQGLTAVTAHDALVQQGAMGQLLLWISLGEVISTIAVIQMLQGSGRAPGYYGFDPAGFLKGASKEKKEDMELKEITNARLVRCRHSVIVLPVASSNDSFAHASILIVDRPCLLSVEW